MREKLAKVGAIVAVASIALTGPAIELDLAGTWSLSGSNEVGAAISCPIAVPGDVHSALRKSDLLLDPFWGRNELKTQWVGRQKWTVSRSFVIEDPFLAKKAVVLRLEDVDTFATIYLNGRELGKTDNRFCRWEFFVKQHLHPGRNELTVVFESAEKTANEIAKGYDHAFPKGNSTWATNHALVRKPACHAGWDWGIAQMITGLCGTVRLIAYDDCKLDYVYADQRFNDDFTHCDLTVFADATDAWGRAFTVTNRFAIDNPPLWWPNGAGPQQFYTYSITVGQEKLSRKIGLRKIEVLNTPDVDENGTSGARMAFRVNGRELFMKGANWIPCSAYENEQNAARYQDLLRSAVAANMNMIRVWGGGQYEKDVFYDLCDEMGLLVWQDFMFSCFVYPGDWRFLESVRSELRHQIKRLRDHASIALWCGDNECVGALEWYDETAKDPAYYKQALVRRHAVESECVSECDPSRAFWPSSPCGGPGDFSDAWHNDSKGDMHNWDVWHENKDFERYYAYRPRFCSEFGYQSFSSREVAETFCSAAQVNPTAPDFEWHQKNLGGNRRILETMARYFRFPQGTDAILYLSQVQQALAIKMAAEGWRAQRPRCMGTLYWQLNDNWPVASWSSIEYGGKWKHLQYHARRFYSPVAVVGLPGGRIAVFNDTVEELAATLTVERWTFEGEVLDRRQMGIKVAADGVWQGKDEKAHDNASVRSFLVMTLKSKHGTFQNDWVSCRYKEIDLPVAHVNVEFDGFRTTLTTDRPAFFVWLNTKYLAGEFSDNSFTLLPGRPVSISFQPKDGSVTQEEFQRSVSVTHLRNTY